MANLHKLPAWNPDGRLVCVVESPRGSKAKFKYDPALKVFTLNRALILGIIYPYDWGFVPSTMASDGDPLDVMIFHDVPTYPGVVMACDPIGALLVTQKKSNGSTGREANHRIFAVPAGSEREKENTDARELPKRVRKELEKFFVAAGALADKDLEVIDWVGPDEAVDLVKEAQKRWKKLSKDVADDRLEK
ncbi:MAG TPA: inorganic diphosphatase [Polyangia bacterium]